MIFSDICELSFLNKSLASSSEKVRCERVHVCTVHVCERKEGGREGGRVREREGKRGKGERRELIGLQYSTYCCDGRTRRSSHREKKCETRKLSLKSRLSHVKHYMSHAIETIT